MSSSVNPVDESGGECCARGDNAPCASGTIEKDLTEDDCPGGCCSGSNDTKQDIAREVCQDNCCSGKDERPVKEEEKLIEEDCQDGCCSGSSAVKQDLVEDPCEDKCCSSENELPSKDDRSSCCSGSKNYADRRDDVPAHCKGKSIPCCDASCVDRLAVRECESTCSTTASGNERRTKGTACGYHKKRVHERYATTLAALGCICRALVALGQESCCATKERSSADERRGRASPRNSSATSTDCCNKKRPSSLRNEKASYRNAALKVQDSACKRGCCESGDSASKAKGRVKSGVAQKDCASDDSTKVIHSAVLVDPADVEKGIAGKEYVALSISGMTCTGCETKLQRVLETLPAVSNLKTSLVMARAEFNLDIAAMSPEGVVKHLERTTEFKCDWISTQGSTIEVLPTGDVKEYLDQPLPLGVNSMQLIGKGVVRINFDPKVIGARELMEKNPKYPSHLAPPSIDPGLAAGRKHVRNMAVMTLFSAVLTIPVLVLAWAPIKHRPIPYGAASLALATVIQVVIAGPFYPKALKSLIFSRMIEMDLLIVLSTSAAYIFSVVSFGYLVSGKPFPTGNFFETSTLLVTLIMVGRWVGALARQKAVESISVRSLQSSTAQLVTEDGADIAEIDTRLLAYGDVFSVIPELRIPTDGIVIAGSSEIDESMLTGESRPIEKQVGSKVIAGSINGSGKLIVRLTHLPGENTISTIAGMVDNAKLSKPKIQDLADRVASYFVPVIVFFTVITFVVWIGVGVAVRKQSSSEAAIQAITYAIAVLIVSCPCAVGLAVPMVIVIGSGVAAERGVVFKSADSIETAHNATHVVFDKTGTLTEGKLKVVATEEDATVRAMILGLAANSKHPVSAAVAAHLTEQGISPARVGGIKAVAGRGIEGMVDGKRIRGGNARWLAVEADPRVQATSAGGHTLFCVTLDSKLYAVFGLSDTVRPDAAATVAELKYKGVHVSLLSGDNDGAVRHTAAQLGLTPDEVKARCTPGDKQEYIQRLLATPVGKRRATVVFVGDGTNDAIGLAQASIGVHMNSGTDVAQSAADVVLMRPSLKGVVAMIDISRAAVLRIKFNFAWSFIYNVLALLFASGALVSASKDTVVRIPPQYAGLGELVSVLPVIAIAVGLRWAKF
ncbi:copper-translocating P-t [Mytilinidion resinicola]|uniref:Copper-translocating P-t n=1 Tax=Mytilinidion resinicola TaxID=574789 RepID=A0A6A6XZR9_9PEZI|nr:copper-translocating P-t [Mytilinidion resinicola]KAF2801900.1 copper-translocating P-t [Mytilinidion resinicola]